MEQYEFIMVMIMFGMSFGSFAGMASYRYVHESSFLPPSHCVHCNTRLSFVDLVPIFSYIFRKGKCGYCGKRISSRYIIIESITTILFTIIAFTHKPGMLAYIVALLTVCLVIISATDFEEYFIPDSMQLVMLILGIMYGWYANFPIVFMIIMPVIGLLIGVTLHYAYYFFTKKEGLGWGDIKFFAVAGLFLTPELIASFYFFSGIIGILLALVWRGINGSKEFPFGPALALSLYLCLVFPEISMVMDYLQPIAQKQ